MWEDVEGQESFPVSPGFELTTLGLLVQEHNYSATTHTQNAIGKSLCMERFLKVQSLCSGYVHAGKQCMWVGCN